MLSYVNLMEASFHLMEALIFEFLNFLILMKFQYLEWIPSIILIVNHGSIILINHSFI